MYFDTLKKEIEQINPVIQAFSITWANEPPNGSLYLVSYLSSCNKRSNLRVIGIVLTTMPASHYLMV